MRTNTKNTHGLQKIFLTEKTIFMKKILIFSMFLFISLSFYAQNITLTSGSLDPLKGEKVIKFEFTYEEMVVGKLTEQEYVDKKVADYNEKEAGKGDAWRENWIEDRTNRFEPKFLELFDKYMQEVGVASGDEGANYVIVLNTEFTEPGFNVGVVRRNASINMSGKILHIESGDQIASIKIKNASANSFSGMDFDSGFRIQESYAKAGREFAKFLIKKGKIGN